MSARSPNPQQRAAIDARGVVLVSAGAGTGKTAVLVERFVRTVCDDGLDVTSLLAITYTDRAAGELRARIATCLRERGRPDLARELDVAWISTIHGFCRRVLMQDPLAAGVDPRFRVLDEAQASVLQSEAFTTALEEFCAGEEPERVQLLATYGARELRRMLRAVYGTLRSAGRELRLEPGSRLDLDACTATLRREAAALACDPAATQLQRRAAAGALDVLDSVDSSEGLLDLRVSSARGPRATPFNDARRAVVDAALEELAARDRVLLEELLQTFDTCYGRLKDAEPALDFEDLQLRVRDFLRDDPTAREREQLRFRAILVDEFQDTNNLQCEIVDLVRGGPPKDVFFVGDEFQSIYGFRHADVSVFRDRRAQAETLLPLTLNYRSRPELLAAVNFLFQDEFGDSFEALEPSEPVADPVFGVPVELIVSDKPSYRDAPVDWRRGEARAVAARVAEIVAAGEASPGEIVYLFAAGTDAEVYEEELRAVGLPTYRAAGRRYFGQQQVVDLLGYLRLLRNRYDDDALLTVLASPFVGVSNDGLVVARQAATRRPIFTSIERGIPDAMPDADARLIRAFRQRYDRLCAASERLPLELLCERIVVEHDYDLAVLVRDDGRRRYANLRKLARLARSYEELRGADIEGFVRFVSDQEAAGAKESDAVAEEEGADAVRLLTIHAAKGLEFKVVVVADAGRERTRDEDILCLSDGRFGFKVAHPQTGTRVGTPSYDDVRRSREDADEAERLRLYYVGMTRAIDRLIVSGSVDLERVDAERTPIAWALTRLDAADALVAADAAPLEIVRGNAAVLVRVARHDTEQVPEVGAAEASPADEVQLALFAGADEALPAPAPRLHSLFVPAVPDGIRVTRLSFSAISQFDRCSYRFWVEREGGLRMVTSNASPRETGGLRATEIGDAAHRLLEEVDLARPVAPSPDKARRRMAEWYPHSTEAESELVGAFVAAYCNSATAERVASLQGVRAEVGFAFEHDGVVLNGRLDVHWSDGTRALVLDYKTNALGDAAPGDVVEEGYALQRLVYALACLRTGCEAVEVVYLFLGQPERPVTAAFTRDDVPELEAALSAALTRVREGEIRATPGDLVCSDCPALDLVCAGPRLRVPDGSGLELAAVQPG